MMGDDTTSVTSSTNADSTPWYQSLIDDVSKLGTAYLSLQQQKELNSINADRAKQGLSPIDASQYLSSASVSVGVSGTTQQTLLIIAGVIGGAWLLTSFMRYRR